MWNVLMTIVGLFPLAAQAQQKQSLDLGTSEIAQILLLPEGDVRVMAVRLINVALEFLAIITLVLVVWSGFLYMFSGGREESVARAVAVLRSAIIGLIIILSSWSIVHFFLASFIGAMTGTSDAGGI